MRYFLLALQFLTRVPVTLKSEPGGRDFALAMAAFPVVGLVLGLALCAANWLLSQLYPPLAVNTLLVILSAVLTGGLHLDGLADTVDGLASGKPREAMLEIMRDSRIGTMGVLALFADFALRIALLGAVPENAKPWVLVAMPLIGRWSMLVPLYTGTYARPEGKALVFFRNMSGRVFLIGTLITCAALSGLFGYRGLLAGAAVGAVSLAASKMAGRALGGLTGDCLGAVNEIAEITFLLVWSIR